MDKNYEREIENWTRIMKTYIAGTAGDIEDADIEAIELIVNEISSARWSAKCQKETVEKQEKQSLSDYVKESTSVLGEKK